MPSCESVISSCFSTSDGRCALFQSFDVMKSSSRRITDGMTFFKAAPTCTHPALLATWRVGKESIRLYRHRTHLMLVLVNICAIEVAIPGLDRPRNLFKSVSVTYEHICARNDAPHSRPREVWRATSRARFVGWLCHFLAEATFEATWPLYGTGKKTNCVRKDPSSFSIYCK